ncbi:anthranilate phosphoribosyltransferase [Evansella cellulosilytica]|uniref:Anthranilate phosphoribosyltransferase n=1 Tax=Evansella cellulosilytica (strain ATCC 21833 / DSM 2522 / FERM P-1141 / JCM 9156 / N-4) TaxID=649639 RepID=E6TZG5_EVAC2|nr:anthranilate phosphoribosyltransferase [Evansella cellulosilytica]ADU30139.1 anthranilate phosphoribosyltransferase [Evansella cellulosilytica DSM 2522]
MRELIEKLVNKHTLSEAEAENLILLMLNGEVSDEQIASILSIIRFRGETVEEIVGFAKGMKKTCSQISPPFSVLDTCGTGGDGVGTYNISTAVAILLSSLNIPVAKHGNRGVSSKTGSADVLEYLQIPIQATNEDALINLEKYNLCFLFAPKYHSAMKHVMKARKELSIKTIFNLLGPLTNPAGATRRLIGVYSVDQARKMAEASIKLGIEKALFVTGEDGLDEFTITGATNVIEVNGDSIQEYLVTPEDVGIQRGDISNTLVQSPEESAALIRSVFNKKGPKEAEDILLLNAGAALYVYGVSETIKEGVQEAKMALGETVIKQLDILSQLKGEVPSA